MGKRLLALLLIVCMLVAVGHDKKIVTRKKEFTIITVSVAASLTDCMEEMERAFNEKKPRILLQFNFGSSGALAQQIEQGAPVDLFFFAGMKQMNELREKGLIKEGSIEKMLKNRLALIVPREGDKKLTFNTLAQADIERIAVGEIESVPAGQYAMEVLEHLKMTSQLAPKLVYAKNVREVLSWVETGNVDAGIVYETDAKRSKYVTIAELADENLHSPIIYPIGIVKGTKALEDVEAFVNFLKTDTTKMIFEKYGFTPIV